MAAIIKTDQLWLDQTTSSAVGAPALIFGADSLSGLYRIGTNNIGLAINGTKLLDLSSATFAVTGAGTFSTTLGVTGKVGIGYAVQSTIQLFVSAAGTDLIFDFGGTGGDVMYSGAANAGITAGENAAASILFLRKNTATSRSINAAGTINASGADYAEYEPNDGLLISKGSIVGFKANGALTLTFAEATRFGVKSTNPSYVGGDSWGGEEAVGARPTKTEDQTDEEFAVILASFETALEAARVGVDRIAYSGKVPCNIVGATPGDYIIAADDSGVIGGVIVTTPTFEQYKNAVGRVNKILPDGRAELAVIIH